MPIILKTDSLKGQCTSVWKVTETVEELLKNTILSDEEIATLKGFKNESRKCEWLAVRTLLQELRPSKTAIKYKENGKPYLTKGEEEISISHSGQYIAIALSSSTIPGVDIEQVHPKIKKIAERFVSEQEAKFLKENNLVEQLCILWCVKEVLYKIHPQGMLNFKNNLLVSPFTLGDEGHLEGTIITDKSTTIHKLTYKRIGNYMLVYTD